MSLQEVKDVLKYRLEQTQNINDLLNLASNLLPRDIPDLIYDLCRYAEHKLNELDEARVVATRRKTEIYKIQGHKPELLSVEQKAMLNLELELLNTLPDYLQISQLANHNLRYQFAEMMVRAALNNKSNVVLRMKKENTRLEIDDEILDRPLTKIIEEATKYLEAPVHMLQMCRVVDQAGFPRLALPIAEYAQQKVLDMKKKLKEKTELLTKCYLIEQEGIRLKRVKKELTKEQTADLNKLLKEIDEFKMPFSESLDASDVNQLDQTTLQISIMMIGCAVNYKKNLMEKKKLVIQKQDMFTKKENEALRDPQELDNLIKKVLNWALEKYHVEDPSHMIQLAKNITDPDLPFVFSIGETVRNRIKQLKELGEQKQEFNKELEQLLDEREKQLVLWKFLSDSKLQRLNELEFQNKVSLIMTPKYVNTTKEKLEYWEFSITQFMLDAIYDNKDKFEDTVKNPNKFPNVPRLSSEQISAERIKYAGFAFEVIKDVEDPTQLYEIAQHVQRRKDSDGVIKIGEKCQKIITSIEAMREIRAPLQTELNSLIAMKEDLIRRNRPFEKQEKVDELQLSIGKLPKWPEYADLFNYHQYDSLNLDIVRVMTSAILDNKTALEEDIARMFRENAPEDIDHQRIEKDRNEIQNKIRQLTKQCLTKFSNPIYLLKFAKDMKARKETEIVLEVTEKCLQKIKELNEQRKVRKPLQMKLDELELAKEESTKSGTTLDNQDEITRLKAHIDALPLWPHFAQVYKDHQYDQTILQATEVALFSVLDDRDGHEAQIAKQYYEDRTAVDHNKVALERKQKENNIDLVMKSCLENVLDPTHIQTLVRGLSPRKEALLVLTLSKHCYLRMKILQKLRQKNNTLLYQIEILGDEEKFLQSRKKSLDDEAATDLVDFRKQLALLEVPEYLSTDSRDQGISDDIALLSVNTTIKKKEDIIALCTKDVEMTEERKQYWKHYITTSEKEVNTLILTHVESPAVLLEIGKILRASKELTFGISVGVYCFKQLSIIRDVREKHQKAEHERINLLKEEEELHKIMKYLPLMKKCKLRGLQLQERLYRNAPPFFQVTFDPDDFALQLAQQIVIMCLENEANLSGNTNNQLMTPNPVSSNFMDIEVSEDTEANKQKAKSTTETIISLCLEHVIKITNLISLAQLLNDRHEYAHVITAGKKCQERIKEKQQEYQKQEEMKQEFERLDNLRLQHLLTKEASSTETENLEAKLEAAKEAIKDLPSSTDIETETTLLNQKLLQITQLVITAAKIENRDKELRIQTIMAFKADTTTERWDQVRALTPEEEWAQVKEELVIYVLRQNTNLNDKIELLLKDGLYKQVVDVFPKPTGNDTELGLLLKVYKTIEEKEPSLLEKLIPVVSRFMKRYYQEQKYDEMKGILDRFQRRFPAVVVSLMAHACDMVMFDIMPSQYSSFVNMLREMKHRLESVNRSDDWNDFFVSFKKKHAGKKKLIQMINLIGDSVWDLERIMSERPAKRIKHEVKKEKSLKSPKTPKGKKGKKGRTRESNED